ncbi:DUF411 domain-containing protein [Noviherbaspirillum aridicola]|uniref:CopG family transcriptional regulator n=1 Tax=Noviherbaspirillum aridicola TaxID=2849687 RepID=A0ABQ4Q0G6_9BURK|nr:DUF411 domain-containing protein [Noviherbaspirillum aridicola]GIZ50531.1 hypothetical protein NCCP691_05450 [Noviherbaspirillum aridicola]
MKSILGAALLVAAGSAFAAGGTITVYKDANCGCCEGWVTHLREAGYQVNAINSPDMSAVKKRLGVPETLGSCHTGVVDKSGQVIEGHVPAAAVARLIARPEVKGVAVPGMPANSPGMGKMDGKLVTVDFQGKPFSKD